MKKWMQRWISLTLTMCMLAVTALGEGRFVLPAGLKVIEEQAFYGDTSVDEVIVQEGTETIGAQAFAHSSLSAITLPGSVTSIADDAFDGCGEVEVSAQEGTYAYDWAVEKGLIDAVTPTPAEYFTYTIENGACTITGYTGSDTEVVIPETIDGATVTAIGDRAFNSNSNLRSVVLPSGVTHIGEYAFCSNMWLSNVNIPAGVTYIGDYAFSTCGWNGTITIPASVDYIGSQAFEGNEGIQSFVVEDGNQKYITINGVLFDKNVETLLAYPPAREAQDYTMPQSVKYIADGAFSSAIHLKGITLPDNLTQIGSAVFRYCNNLSSITIPQSVTNMGDWVFEGCESLKSIVLSEKLTRIGDGTFALCSSLESITIPAGVETIGMDAFFHCDSLENIVIPAKVKNIGDYVFNYCIGLTEITISDGVTSIGNGSFFQCSSLESITIPESVTNIGTETFYGCDNLTATVVENSYAHTWCVENGVAYVLAGAGEATPGEATPGEATPDEATPAEYFTYTIENGACTITGYTGSDTEVVIPEEIEGAAVVSIGERAFIDSNLVSVEIPASVTTIQARAFISTGLVNVTLHEGLEVIERLAVGYCNSLASIEIPASVTTIGDSAFTDCTSLTNVTLHEGLEVIDRAAFENCYNLMGVHIPDTVTAIGDLAFAYCFGLKRFNIPASVMTLGVGVLSSCEGLTEIQVDPDNTEYTGIDNVVFNKSGDTLILFPGGKTGTYNIPDTVTRIMDYAFVGCTQLTGVFIPASVTDVGRAFLNINCLSLTQIQVDPNSPYYKSIDNVLFDTDGEWILVCCPPDKTGTYEIPDNTVYIGEDAFSECVHLTDIVIPPTVLGIGSYAFALCSELKNVVIYDGVRGIGEFAFWGCNHLESIYLPPSLEEIGGYIFSECPKVVARVKEGSYAHQWCQDNGVPYELALQYTYVIENGECTITGGESGVSLEIPAEIEGAPVTAIADYAFMDWRSLESIQIPESVRYIGKGAFQNCESLREVELPSGLTEISEDLFNHSGLVSITIPENVTSIGAGAFEGCVRLAYIDFSDNVTEIGDRAFMGCLAWNVWSLPEKLERIGAYAFAEWFNDGTQFTIPDSVTYIGDYAFSAWVTLKTIALPAGLEYLGAGAFSGCCDLESIEIPEKITSIADKTFMGCTSLKQITIPESVTSIGTWAFASCSSLEDLPLPSGVTRISDWTFAQCSGFKDVVIPESVTDIGAHAFDTCDNLWSLTIPQSVTYIDETAFENCWRMENRIVAEDSYAHTWCVENGWTFTLLPGDTVPAEQFAYTITDDTCVITGYIGSDTKVIIPETIDGATVTAIGSEAFSGCGTIERIEVAQGVTSIGARAFANCVNLKDIALASSVTSIGEGAFAQCSALTQIDLPYGVTSISEGTFRYCSALDHIVLPYGVTTIGAYAFADCASLTGIFIPTSVTDIGENAWSNSPDAIAMVEKDSYAHTWCEAQGTAYALLSAQEAAPAEDFAYTIVNGECRIRSYHGTAQELILPSQIEGVPVTYIGGNAFTNAASMTRITIPATVTEIAGYAFAGCAYLQTIDVDANNPVYGSIDGALVSRDGETLFYCPAGKAGVYAVPSGVKRLASASFYDSNTLTCITIPASVTSIEFDAISSCENLEAIEVDAENQNYTSTDGVLLSKDGETLILCPWHKTGAYVVPEGVKTIAAYAFDMCGELESIVLASTVTRIDKWAFYECPGLKQITIPASVTSIGTAAFLFCDQLESIEVDAANPIFSSMDGVLFCENGKALLCYPEGKKDQEYSIPSGVTSIYAYAISSGWLLNIEIPMSVTYMGEWALNVNWDCCATVGRDSYAADWCEAMGVSYYAYREGYEEQ